MLYVLVVIGAGILLTNCVMIGAGVVVYRKIQANLSAFVSAPAEGEPSPLAIMTRQAATDFGNTLFINIKRHISVPANHLARQENAIGAEMAGAALEEAAPQWSALLGLLPGNVQKRILKNPTAAAALVSMLGRGGGGGIGGGNGAGADTGSVRNRLKLQG